MRDCMDRRVTPPKRVTSPTWGPPPPGKQTLTRSTQHLRLGYVIALQQLNFNEQKHVKPSFYVLFS